MDYTYERESPECSIIIMEISVIPFINNSPTDNHDYTNNLLCCVDPDIVNIYMYYLPQNEYFYDSGQWKINKKKYKVLTDMEYYVNYLLCQCITEPLEDEYDGHHLVLSINF